MAFAEEFDVSKNQTDDTVKNAFEFFYSEESEQNLAEEMYDELCEKFGLKCQFYSRIFDDISGIFGEDRNSLFTSEYTFPIKLFPLDFTKYNPSSAFNKSQYTTNDYPRFHVVKKRFALESEKYLGESIEPKPGDIFLLEMTDDIWKFNFTEPEAQYYDRGKAFVWELMCERFSFSGETFETGDNRLDLIKDVDNLNIFPDKDSVTGDNLRLDELVKDGLESFIDDSETDIFGGCK